MSINNLTKSLCSCITATLITQQCAAYEIHEWGTFTSISGSDGILLNGLHHEEERLPFFVHALSGMQNRGPSMTKGWMRPVRNVTIKMETPVIYFYSDKAMQARVEVGFKGGSISQWYPMRSGGESVHKTNNPRFFNTSLRPPYKPLKEDVFKNNGGIDFSQTRHGAITWDVDVLGKEASRGLVFKSGETLNWLRPRNPKANILRVGKEHEDYLFYRGIGNFALPITLTVDQNEALHINNRSHEAIPFILVHEVIPGQGVRFLTLDKGIGTGKSKTIQVSDMKTSANWSREIYDSMFQGLTHSGLFAEEAHGMIQTWWDSYFTRPGLRVFWIVPNSDTNRILPLRISPAPQKIVRTLVGRSEILRPSFEQTLVKEYLKKDKKKSKWPRYQSGRFGESYQQRIKKLLSKQSASASTP